MCYFFRMNRPLARRRARSLRQQLARMGRAQAAFMIVSVLMVCVIVGGTLLTVIIDAVQSSDDDADPEEFNASARDDFVDSLRATVEANPNDAAAMGLLANVLAQDGRIDEAIDWYERSLGIDPTSVQIRLSFALSLADAGKPVDAEVQYRKIIEADPAQAEAWYYLGELYRTWAPPRLDDAVDAYLTVLTLAPGSVIADRANEALAELGIGTPTASPAAATPESGGRSSSIPEET